MTAQSLKHELYAEIERLNGINIELLEALQGARHRLTDVNVVLNDAGIGREIKRIKSIIAKATDS